MQEAQFELNKKAISLALETDWDLQKYNELVAAQKACLNLFQFSPRKKSRRRMNYANHQYRVNNRKLNLTVRI
jgi:hypothetical protein